MITYETALETAKELKKHIVACAEYTDAYVFKNKADEWSIGGAGACCVLKDSGKAINTVEYFDNYEAKHIRDFDIK